MATITSAEPPDMLSAQFCCTTRNSMLSRFKKALHLSKRSTKHSQPLATNNVAVDNTSLGVKQHEDTARPLSTKLCNDCQTLIKVVSSLLHPENEERSKKLTFEREHLARLAANIATASCHLCALIQTALLEPSEALPLQEDHKLFFFILPDRPLGASIELIHNKVLTETFCGASLEMEDVQKNTPSSLMCGSTWSGETIKTVRDWLSKCASSHDDCKKKPETARLPLRLIDVMPKGFTQITDPTLFDFDSVEARALEALLNVRIVSTAGLPADTQYVTLSHRWTQKPKLLLNKISSYMLQQDIMPYLLIHPEALIFRHAIHVARCLGLRYIWIDALCIMQDNAAEKAHEIMKMDDIYVNGVLNIAGTEASEEGLIVSRNLQRINPCTFTLLEYDLKPQPQSQLPQTEPSSSSTIPTPAVSRPRTLRAFARRDWLEVTAGGLNLRGWVFQERTLAPRVLHFTRDQLYWECSSQTACEILPSGLNRVNVNTRGTSMGVGVSSSSSESDIKTRWHGLVRFYAHSHLSFIDDRLLAFSGVAKRFGAAAQRSSDDYVAGMWKTDLPMSLLWEQYAASVPALATSFAPTWSWAHVQAPTSYIGPPSYKEDVAEVQDVRYTPRSANAFDGVVGAVLRIRAPMVRVERVFRENKPWITFAHTEMPELPHPRSMYEQTIGIKWDDSTPSVAEALEQDKDEGVQAVYHLLVISQDISRIQGLVLCRTGKKGVYTRVGVFIVFIGGANEEIWAARHGTLETLEEGEYLEAEVGWYVVEIV